MEYFNQCISHDSYNKHILKLIFKYDNISLLKTILKTMSPSEIYFKLQGAIVIQYDPDDSYASDYSDNDDHDVSSPPTMNCFEYIVERGLSVNEPGKDGNAPFHYAFNYNVEMIPYLLHMGGDPNIKDNEDTPIHWYCSKNIMMWIL